MRFEHDHSLEQKIATHAANLRQHGIGDTSRMCRESVFKTMIDSPDLPNAHAEEGRKFAAMAQRIAPPELVAAYMSEAKITESTEVEIEEGKLLRMIPELLVKMNPSQEGLSDSARGKNNSFRFKPSEIAAYARHCTADPTLQLSHIYYSIGLQQCVANIIGKMGFNEHMIDIAEFGGQFNSSNLCTTVPVIMHIMLERNHGKDAPIDAIDQKTIDDAMRFMHDTEQFEVQGRNRLNGEVITLHCPMERYLFDLFVRQEGLLPFIRSTKQFHDQCVQKALKSKLTDDWPEIHHLQNAVAIARGAQSIIV